MDDLSDLESLFSAVDEADGDMELDRKEDESAKEHRHRIGKMAQESLQRRRQKGGDGGETRSTPD